MSKAAKIRLPGSSDRTVIVGQSGSGKTQFGAWLLSKMNLEEMPWIVFDYKDEDIFASVEKANHITYDSPLPSKPGLYILRVMSDEENEEMSNFLLRVHSKGGIGLYVDEGLVMGQHNKGFKICLTQGRSLKIPMIVLTQRPVGVSPWVFSEAKFWQVFDLMKKGDRQIVADYLPIPADYNLRQYHSYYYDVNRKILKKFSPVPDSGVIVADIDAKLPTPRRTL